MAYERYNPVYYGSLFTDAVRFVVGRATEGVRYLEARQEAIDDNRLFQASVLDDIDSLARADNSTERLWEHISTTAPYMHEA